MPSQNSEGYYNHIGVLKGYPKHLAISCTITSFDSFLLIIGTVHTTKTENTVFCNLLLFQTQAEISYFISLYNVKKPQDK